MRRKAPPAREHNKGEKHTSFKFPFISKVNKIGNRELPFIFCNNNCVFVLKLSLLSRLEHYKCRASYQPLEGMSWKVGGAGELSGDGRHMSECHPLGQRTESGFCSWDGVCGCSAGDL